MNSLLSWNCRGLGSSAAVLSLGDLVRNQSPDIIFLCETKSWNSEMCRIQQRLQFEKGDWVESKGRAGGVALFWKDEVDLKIRAKGDRFIDFEVVGSSGDRWRGTGIYDCSESGQMHNTWELIRELDNMPHMPWVVVGDFNEVLYE